MSGLFSATARRAWASILANVGNWLATNPPGSAPVAAAGAAGALTGTYHYAVAFRTASGSTDASNPSAPVVVAGQRVNLTSIPVSADPAVIARDLYRTPAGAVDSVLSQFIGSIADNVTTTYVDNLADGALGAPAPRENTTGGFAKLNAARVLASAGHFLALGVSAHPASTGYANVALGPNAMRLNSTGYRNTACGMDALENNTTGARNTATGVHALGSTQAANDSTATGYGALQSATEGFNTAMGSLALSDNTTGGNNTATGAFAMQLNTTGNANTADGSNALHTLASGTGNTGAGAYSGYSLATGNFNTLVGFQAGFSSGNVSTSVAVGALSLFSNVAGQNNVAIGPSAGYYETGDNHLWIDNQPRGDLVAARELALIYGTFAVDKAGQQVTLNGQLNVAAGFALKSRPIVVANYVMTASDSVLKFQGVADITLTLLSGPPQTDRILRVKNLAGFAVVSASANVIPLAGGAATTAILPAGAGKWADLQFNGAQWEILAAG